MSPEQPVCSWHTHALTSFSSSWLLRSPGQPGVRRAALVISLGALRREDLPGAAIEQACIARDMATSSGQENLIAQATALLDLCGSDVRTRVAR